ncbi:MAG: 50S ribosomal protein L6 [Candidatus Buchananbacteria bacterium]|jgi:large subunit ribosomal protein L6
MSRIGKNPITIPSGVEVTLTGDVVEVKGPKGSLKEKLHPLVSAELKDGTLQVKIKDEENKSQRALWGLFGSLIRNMITGVTIGFSKQLEINGVGMKYAVSGNKVNLNVGFSHPVEFAIPAGITIAVEANIMTISGIDKQLVGETAAQIRRIKKVEPYKGKGIRYVGEKFIKKAGKAAGKGK